jgi:thiol-disulfide isomerase/thioredoxin
MNKLTRLFITSLFSLASYQNIKANDMFVIAGQLDQIYKGKVFLKYSDKEGHFRTDSFVLKGNRFYFTGQVNKYFANASLVIDVAGANKFSSYKYTREHSFGIENNRINLSIYGYQLRKIKVSGNITEKEIDFFYKRLAKRGKKKADKIKNTIAAYCEKFPSSNTSIYILFTEASLFSDSELNQIFNKISLDQQNSYYGNFLKRIMHRRFLQFSQVGLILANFEAKNSLGTITDLYSLTRKGVVLLDFWATWCNPCRESSPALRNLYNKYRDAGFTIIGISCDKKEDEGNWEKAIQADSVFYWPHILTSPPNLEKYTNRIDLLREYDISAFPTLILVGADNTIVLRTSDEFEVEKKLKEIYGK